MSTLLEQAIIDAEALRESAVKSAEQAIIEKYAPEVKRAVETLLEQEMMPPQDPMMPMGDPMAMGAADPMAMGMGGPPPPGQPVEQPPGIPTAPLAATAGEALCPCPDEGQQITIDFNELAAAVDAEEKALEAQQVQGAMMDQAAGMQGGMPVGMMPPSPMGPAAAPATPMPIAEGLEIADGDVLNLTRENLQELVQDEQDEDLPDELIAQIAEEIRANLSAPDSSLGGRTTPTASMQEADEIVQAEVAVAEAQDDNEELNERIQTLELQVNDLTSQNGKYREALQTLQERMAEVNVSNARLLYTNRVLNDPSLNERQRTKIVEAISQCGSIEEAKVIYETLQGAVREATIKRAPSSLSEAVIRDRSLLIPRRKEQNSPDTQAYERMKALAGINKT